MSSEPSHPEAPLEPVKHIVKQRFWGKKSVCPNCNFKFGNANNFCPNCGQPNRTHKRPIRHFVGEFFADLLSLDTRAYATLRDLLLKPGLLTKRYNADSRVIYTPPLRFYVLSSLFFFLTVSWLSQATIQQADAEIQDAMQEPDSLVSNMNLTLFGGFELGPDDFRELQELDTYTHDSVDSVLTALGKNSNWFNTRTVLGLSPIFSGRFSLEQYYRRLLQNLSYSLFFFMPILALLFKLLYIRRHQFYTEHLIFSIHLHTFAFLLGMLCLWIDYFQDFIAVTQFAFIGIMIYMAVAMKVVYEQGWIKTLVKGDRRFLGVRDCSICRLRFSRIAEPVLGLV